MSGFALTHRTVFDHPLFRGDAARLGAWLWLVGKACWRPTPFDINGRIITLERGQLCASLRQLAEQWGWSKSAVDRFLARLETETMIERKAGQGRLVITICNYSKYQDSGDGRRDSGGTPSGTAAGQQRDTKEQGNKGTSIETIVSIQGEGENLPLEQVDFLSPIPDEAWEKFEAHRREMDKPLTPEARKRARKVLTNLAAKGEDPTRVIEQTIDRAWLTFFPVKADASEKKSGWRFPGE